VFALVQELGGMTVEEAMERFTALEITEWKAFFKIQARIRKTKSARLLEE
jgi:hypothetical protein